MRSSDILAKTVLRSRSASAWARRSTKPSALGPAARQAATQARWRARVRNGEIVVKVVTRPSDRAKLVAVGYVEPRRRNDRDSVGKGIARLLDLMTT
jgi:hypothetical protein